MIRSKFLFCALGFFFPGAGFNCLYLQGLKSYWGWLQFAAIIGGISGWIILSTTELGSFAGWFLLTLGFISIEASFLTTIAYGLRSGERWDAEFNPGIAPEQATQTGWPTILLVIFCLVFGAALMMSFFAIAFEQFFISQLIEARKLSQ
jgi:hypothetical protein